MYLPRAFAAASLTLVAFVVACPGPDPQTGSTSASGSGAGANPSTTNGTGAFPHTTSGTGGSPQTSSSGGFTTTGGFTTGTGVACTDAGAQCPVSDTVCLTSTCSGGFCASTIAPPHTPCTDHGGAVCDGSGSCVVCVDKSDCAQGDVCTATGATAVACQPGIPNGKQCTDPTLCQTGNCVDSVCCDKPCAGVCMGCTAIKTGAPNDGTCSPIAFGTDPDKSCTIFCNGQGACLPGKRVFVTSGTYPGTFGTANGAKDADPDCQAAADSIPLGGMWKAWTSDSHDSPLNRFTQSTDPYVLLTGKVVALDWTALTHNPLMNPISLDESMASVQGPVWTGTMPVGVASGNVCVDWKNASATGDVGDPSQTGSAWTQSSTLDCPNMAHFYCFEQ